MCGTCGCGDGAKATLTNLQTGATMALARDHGPDAAHEHLHADGMRHSHPHDHPRAHEHDHAHASGEVHEHVHADGTLHSHAHGHAPAHGQVSAHGGAPSATIVELEARLLAKNDALAARNRGWLEGREVLALNLVSSPGAGKTSLLERTIRDLAGEMPILVIEGDQATDADGLAYARPVRRRCRSTPAPVAISKPTWSRAPSSSSRPRRAAF